VFEADRLEDSLVLDPVMDGRIYIEIMAISREKGVMEIFYFFWKPLLPALYSEG